MSYKLEYVALGYINDAGELFTIYTEDPSTAVISAGVGDMLHQSVVKVDITIAAGGSIAMIPANYERVVEDDEETE